MLTNSQRSFINVSQANLREHISATEQDNIVLESFLRDETHRDVIANEHVTMA